ncbi:type II toxin-antitoxin system PemK/MazF family toxin [Radiobacillus sp. PE A8.2]|uniref:type II toxin-antitoxin system PemK/MazF family toxin n=1 Tax=Radiobacillus sp. PE A8.2 TaxID=3380349 RepID=UPI003890F66F
MSSKIKNPTHGDIYWANLKPAKGSEQNGYRPVFIVSNNIMNSVSPVVLVVPMTRTPKVIPPFIIPYNMDDIILIDHNVRKLEEQGHHFNDEINNANILCQQARSIDKSRLIMKVGEFKTDTYAELVKQAINFLYALDGCDGCHVPLRPDGLKCGNCKKTHRKRCYDCKSVFPIYYNFCPNCGKEARSEWTR